MNRQKLVIFWSKKENDFLIRYPSKPDGSLLCGHFCNERPYIRLDGTRDFEPAFVKELEARGYDTKTLRFSVERRKP